MTEGIGSVLNTLITGTLIVQIRLYIIVYFTEYSRKLLHLTIRILGFIWRSFARFKACRGRFSLVIPWGEYRNLVGIFGRTDRFHSCKTNEKYKTVLKQSQTCKVRLNFALPLVLFKFYYVLYYN
jgi:hypothetical protein